MIRAPVALADGANDEEDSPHHDPSWSDQTGGRSPRAFRSECCRHVLTGRAPQGMLLPSARTGAGTKKNHAGHRPNRGRRLRLDLCEIELSGMVAESFRGGKELRLLPRLKHGLVSGAIFFTQKN